ncbi:uncharacterized protein [Haliotis cracherodii]|uniref:uncharacterized protein n=1 Tax=Haliotis cracherodii TaxID=6455 RepID=UPI0039EAD728
MLCLESLQNHLELDSFEEYTPFSNFETRSAVKTLVLTHCYGRGKTKAEICVPRLPRGITLVAANALPSVELRSILPTKKRMGRGRARILSQHAANQAEQVKQFPTSTARHVSMGTPKESPFQHPFEHPTGSTDFGTTLFDDSDCYMSDEENQEEILLPSQRGMVSRPFLPPPKHTKSFDVKSKNDFPTLGGAPQNDVNTNTNNAATSVRTFPPLPPRLSKKVTNVDIIFEPMKDKKSKKKRKSENKNRSETRMVDTESQRMDIDSDGTMRDKYVICDAEGIPGKENVTVKPMLELSALREPLPVEADVNDMSGDKIDSKKTVVSDSCDVKHVKGLPLQHTDSWTIVGANVIQIEGVPKDGNTTELEEMVSAYGVVLESQKKTLSDGRGAMRFRYSDSDFCEWAVSCLHDSDCVFPVLIHLVLWFATLWNDGETDETRERG